MDKELKKEKMNETELKDKELEQVSGGFQFDLEPGSHPKPKPKPKPKIEPIPFYPADAICVNRNKGTEACILVNKGQLIQCSGCSKNHD